MVEFQVLCNEARWNLIKDNWWHGMTTPKEQTKKPRNPHTWPDLPFKELMCMIFIMVLLIVWSLGMDAPLMEEATPSRTENPAKAPWYFIGLQELLVYFDPWFAGVVLPTIILVGLILIPYLDINREGTGVYSFSARKFAMVNFLFGYGLWMGAIVIGQFMRGPNWFFFWPWEPWDAAFHSAEIIELKNLGLLTGLGGSIIYFGLGFWIPIKFKWKIYQQLDRVRYILVMSLVLMMYSVPIKMVLRLVFNIRYVITTPWFNI